MTREDGLREEGIVADKRKEYSESFRTRCSCNAMGETSVSLQ